MTSPQDPDETDQNSLPPKLTIDWDLYGEYLEDSDLTDDQKREFIETLWSIIVSFVDLGFGIHPLQQACGQDDLICTTESGTVIDSGDQHIQNIFLEAAGHKQDDRGERTDS